MNHNHASEDAHWHTPVSVVAAASFLIAGGSSLLVSVCFAALIDAGPDMGEIIFWGVASGCVLATLVIWLAVDQRARLAVAVGLAATVGPGICVTFAVGHEVTVYLYKTIGPLSPDLGFAIGPASLAAVSCLVVTTWKVAHSQWIPRALKWAILSAGAAVLIAMGLIEGRSIQERFAAFQLLRAQADEAAQGLRRLGLISEWHPRYGLAVTGTPSGGGIDPALIPQLVTILSEVPHVRLRFAETVMGDENLPALAALHHLWELDLTDTQVTDGGLASLKAFPGLSSIKLGGCRITDTGLTQLAQVPTLTGIFLGTSDKNRHRVQVTDEGLMQLKRLRALNMLQVPRTVSEMGMHRLRAEIPGLAIYYGY